MLFKILVYYFNVYTLVPMYYTFLFLVKIVLMFGSKKRVGNKQNIYGIHALFFYDIRTLFPTVCFTIFFLTLIPTLFFSWKSLPMYKHCFRSPSSLRQLKAKKAGPCQYSETVPKKMLLPIPCRRVASSLRKKIHLRRRSIIPYYNIFFSFFVLL